MLGGRAASDTSVASGESQPVDAVGPHRTFPPTEIVETINGTIYYEKIF